MNHSISDRLFNQSLNYIPGGVNSPVRAFQSVGSNPVFIERAQGARVYDVDGNQYLDYVGSWGPMILGHAHPSVLAAVQTALSNGTSFGAPTEKEYQLARMIVEAVPGVEQVRLVNSGTEAVMSAVRLARAFTGRDKIIKFEGCYHGHADSFLIKAGSGAATLGCPSSPGVPQSVSTDTILAVYNDTQSVIEILNQFRGQIAAIVVEPVAGNMGVVPPQSDFLPALRQLCDQEHILLIFDEVITGFRLSLGGAQQFYNIKPDLTTLGKIIGGGFPIGAYGGKKEIMQLIAPEGPVYQAGTLSGNPIAVTAGITTLEIVKKDSVIERINQLAIQLTEGIKQIIKSYPLQYNSLGSLATLFFNEQPVTNFKEAVRSNTDDYARFFRLMLRQGIYLAPSQFEAAFLSAAHTEETVAQTLDCMETAFKELF